MQREGGGLVLFNLTLHKAVINMDGRAEVAQ